MAVTQKDIAERLNLSQSQVARALSGRSTGRSTVSEETRQRIKKVAQEMGYDAYANREAASMVGRRRDHRAKTGVVGVAISAPKGAVLRAVPFYAPFLEGVEEEAQKLGLDVCIILKRFQEVPRVLRGRDFDGVIVSGFTMDQLPVMRDSGLSFVTFQVQCEDTPCVRPDDKGGIYQTTRHLLELGHRKIAFLGTLSSGDSKNVVELRLQGYKDALAEFGIEVNPDWIEDSLFHPQTIGNVYCSGCDKCAACRGWHHLKFKSGVGLEGRPPFTAVVCYNDPIAMGLIQQAQKDGLSVPEDLSVTGFDNISGEYHFHPSVTSVGSSHFEMGRSALRLLDSLINQSGGEVFCPTDGVPGEQIVFPIVFKMGESTGPPAQF